MQFEFVFSNFINVETSSGNIGSVLMAAGAKYPWSVREGRVLDDPFGSALVGQTVWRIVGAAVGASKVKS